MTPEKVRQNLEALVNEGAQVLTTKRGGDMGTYVDESAASQWSTNVISMLRSTFGADSDHYRVAKDRAVALNHGDAHHHDAVRLHGVMKAALVAWDNGYVFELRQLAEAAVEASLIDQAEELVSKGYVQAAAVLGGAVLEQHLRSLCAKYGVSDQGANGKPKTMEPLNQDLRQAGAYNALQQKQITHLAGIRNEAAHGNSVTADDAKRLVQEAVFLCAKLT